MFEYLDVIRTFHLLGAAVLFGTGIGIAFFFFRSRFTDDIAEKHYAARTTVLADFCFTLPAVILQPLTGAYLVLARGYDFTERWLVTSYALYLLAGACWLPVLFLQLKMRDMLKEARDKGTPLPPLYARYYLIWFWLGWPAFIGLVGVFHLMNVKP